MLDEETKKFIRAYVREVLAEGGLPDPKPLLEVVTIRKITRAASSGAGWVDVEPGEYLVTAVEERSELGNELVSIKRKDGVEYPLLVTRTARGQTAIGDEIWGS